jgi:hypothetical protein
MGSPTPAAADRDDGLQDMLVQCRRVCGGHGPLATGENSRPARGLAAAEHCASPGGNPAARSRGPVTCGLLRMLFREEIYGSGPAGGGSQPPMMIVFYKVQQPAQGATKPRCSARARTSSLHRRGWSQRYATLDPLWHVRGLGSPLTGQRLAPYVQAPCVGLSEVFCPFCFASLRTMHPCVGLTAGSWRKKMCACCTGAARRSPGALPTLPCSRFKPPLKPTAWSGHPGSDAAATAAMPLWKHPGASTLPGRCGRPRAGWRWCRH